MMVPRDSPVHHIDVTAAMNDDAVNPTGMLDNVFDDV